MSLSAVSNFIQKSKSSPAVGKEKYPVKTFVFESARLCPLPVSKDCPSWEVGFAWTVVSWEVGIVCKAVSWELGATWKALSWELVSAWKTLSWEVGTVWTALS